MLESNVGRSFLSVPAWENHGALCFWIVLKNPEVMVVLSLIHISEPTSLGIDVLCLHILEKKNGGGV
ncbi:hypothetical protein DXF83_01910, partial [Enterobacter hormaechei]